jgi:hypothetical protein
MKKSGSANNATVKYELNTEGYTVTIKTPETTSIYVSQPKDIVLGAEGSVCGACDYLSCSCPTLDSGKTNLTKLVQELTKKD